MFTLVATVVDCKINKCHSFLHGWNSTTVVYR